MARQKTFFLNILEERIAYRLVLSFALMSVIPMLLTMYMVTTMWLPDLGKWAQVSVFILLGLSVSILGYVLSRTIVYTILKTSQLAKEIADGDLSKRIELRNENSEMGLLVQSFNKITTQLEQKIEQLTVSEEKYRHLVENVPDLLYYLDPAGTIVSLNEEVTELLGYAKEDLQNQSFATVVHENDYDRYERVLRERRQDESRLVQGLRIRLRTKSGEYRTFEINSRGIYDKSNNFVGTEGLARDITAQLALETEREEFLYMLTHDIRNPISAILFIVYMLRDGTISPEKYSEYYDKIEKACNGVIQLAEDFLEYKKFELGKVSLEKREMDLSQMIRNVALTYCTEAEAKSKSITINGKDCKTAPANEKTMAEIDEKYFQRVVENLITNAIKFARTQIDIELTENEDSVTLSISDDGPGVSEKEREDIFKLFHTSPGSRTAKGIGVGLASAHKTVHAHGGRLWVERGQTGKCSFMVSVPRSLAFSEAESGEGPLSDAVPSGSAEVV